MIIDEDIISGGITPVILAELIEKHETKTRGRYDKLRNYYMGNHAINNRTRHFKNSANNKITTNHAKYITDMIRSYLVGNPISYAVDKEYDIEAVKNAYLEQDIASLDSEIVKDMSIYGRAYELVYADEETKPCSVRLAPENTFVCYSQSAKMKPLFGVYYYKKYHLDGTCAGSVCRVYDDSFEYTFIGWQDSYSGMTLNKTEPHYFFDVPLIEYRNNTEAQGDFEQLISLIDAYNSLQSDRVNDKEQFVNALLFLRNCDITTEQAKEMLEQGILMGDDDAAAEYLSKVLDEADTKVLRDDLKEDIHRMSHVPDLSDESFGNNLSGVAIKYKLLGFEQHIKNKERCLMRTLRERFKLYNAFLTVLNYMQEVPTHRVDIEFTYNLPSNNLETAQMISYLDGKVTNEKLIGQLDYIDDPKEEAELAKQEQADKKAEEYRRRIDENSDLAEGGGY